MTRPRTLGIVLAALVVAGCRAVSPSLAPVQPSGVPSPAATGAEPCAVTEVAGVPPSNRLVDLQVQAGRAADRLAFRFALDAAGPAGRGTVRAAEPPFFEGGSGDTVEVDGERFLEVRFEGLVIADEEGNPVYTGARELRPELPAIRHVVVTEQFEGVTTFVIGYDGAGCVTLGGSSQPEVVVVDIAHG